MRGCGDSGEGGRRLACASRPCRPSGKNPSAPRPALRAAAVRGRRRRRNAVPIRLHRRLPCQARPQLLCRRQPEPPWPHQRPCLRASSDSSRNPSSRPAPNAAIASRPGARPAPEGRTAQPWPADWLTRAGTPAPAQRSPAATAPYAVDGRPPGPSTTKRAPGRNPAPIQLRPRLRHQRRPRPSQPAGAAAKATAAGIPAPCGPFPPASPHLPRQRQPRGRIRMIRP